MSLRELEQIRERVEVAVEAIEIGDSDLAVECLVTIIEIADQADAEEATS